MGGTSFTGLAPASSAARRRRPCRTSCTPCADELEGPETKDPWLIHEAVEAPLQFTKSREMILQPRKALLDSEEVLFTSFEGSAASWGVFVIIAMLDKEYR